MISSDAITVIEFTIELCLAHTYVNGLAQGTSGAI